MERKSVQKIIEQLNILFHMRRAIVQDKQNIEKDLDKLVYIFTKKFEKPCNNASMEKKDEELDNIFIQNALKLNEFRSIFYDIYGLKLGKYVDRRTNTEYKSLFESYLILKETLFSQRDFQAFPHSVDHSKSNFLNNYFSIQYKSDEDKSNLLFIEELEVSANPQKKYEIVSSQYKDILCYTNNYKAAVKNKQRIFMNIKQATNDGERLGMVIDCFYSILYRSFLGPRVSLSVPIFKGNQFYGIGSVFLPKFKEMRDIYEQRSVLSKITNLWADKDKPEGNNSFWTKNKEYQYIGLTSISLIAFLLKENDLHIRNYGSTVNHSETMKGLVEVTGKIDHDYIQWYSYAKIAHLSGNFSAREALNRFKEFKKFNLDILFNYDPFELDYQEKYVTKADLRFSPFNSNDPHLIFGHALRSLRGKKSITTTSPLFSHYMQSKIRKNYAMHILELALTIRQIVDFDFYNFKSMMDQSFLKPFLASLGIHGALRNKIIETYNEHIDMLGGTLRSFKFKAEHNNSFELLLKITEELKYLEAQESSFSTEYNNEVRARSNSIIEPKKIEEKKIITNQGKTNNLFSYFTGRKCS